MPEARIELDPNLLPQLVVMSAIWEYPGGGQPHIANHCRYLNDAEELNEAVATWRAELEENGCRVTDLVVTFLPDQRPGEIDKLLLEFIRAGLRSIIKQVPDLELLERTRVAVVEGKDPTTDSRWFEFADGEFTFNGTLNHMFGQFVDGAGERIGDMDRDGLIRAVATGHHEIDHLRQRLLEIYMVAAGLREELAATVKSALL